MLIVAIVNANCGIVNANCGIVNANCGDCQC